MPSEIWGDLNPVAIDMLTRVAVGTAPNAGGYAELMDMLPACEPIPGETGIVFPFFPVGFAQRYGIFPDGVTDWEGSYGTRMSALYANSALPGLTVRMPGGDYATSINMGLAHSGSKIIFEDCRFYGIMHYTGGIHDVSHMGKYRVLDRLGVTGEGSYNIRLGHVVCESDPAKNTASPGKAGRGAHIVDCPDFYPDLVEVIECGPCDASSTGSTGNLAAIWLECSGRTGIKGRYLNHNSDTNGIFISALDIDVEVESRGHGKSVIAAGGGSALQGMDTTQTNLGSGVIMHRVTGRADIRQSQVNAAPLADTYSVLINETGISSTPLSRNKPLIVPTLHASVGDGNRGVCFGEVGTPTVNSVTELGDVVIELRAGESLAATYGMFNVNPPSTNGDSKISVSARSVHFCNSVAQLCFNLKGGSGTRVNSYVKIEGYRVNNLSAGGKVLVANGAAQVDALYFSLENGIVNYSGGSSAATKLLDVNTCSFKIRGLKVKAASAAGTPLALFTACTDFTFEEIICDGLRATDHVTFTGGTTRGRLRGLNFTSLGGTGIAMTFAGTFTGCSLEEIDITAFQQGFNSGASMVWTNCNASGCRATGNTTNTDMTLAQFPAVNQFANLNFAV